MRKYIIFLIPFICLFTANINAINISLTSTSFANNGTIPKKYACLRDGQNCSPQLSWENTPKNAKSIVIICEDESTPQPFFIHWILFNIPASTTQIAENTNVGTLGKNNFGNNQYDGPCPPTGDPAHNYVFRIYALDKNLDLEVGATKEVIDQNMAGHFRETGQLSGKYSSQKSKDENIPIKSLKKHKAADHSE